MGALNEFLYGAIWLAMIVALGFTGWRATNRGYFQAVSESYYGRKAQLMGGACLLVAIVAGILFVQHTLTVLVFGLRSGAGLFFLLGAALGAYLTLRFYVGRV